MSKKINIAIQVILVVAALAGSIFASFTPANSLLRWYNIDDAFYYYKVAQNVLAGHGFTFDGICLHGVKGTKPRKFNFFFPDDRVTRHARS